MAAANTTVVAAKPEPGVVSRKIAVLGARAVGKSSFVSTFVHGMMSETYETTIESTYNRVIRFKGIHFATDIVDTAGMDEYSRLSRNASVGVQGYILVFSIVSRQSFEMVSRINALLLNTLGDVPDVPRVLVGTMKDLAESRQVQLEDAQNLADSWNIPYIECSSKTGESVSEVYHVLLREIAKDDGLLVEQNEVGCCVS
jgi:Ras homolog enriched in brain